MGDPFRRSAIASGSGTAPSVAAMPGGAGGVSIDFSGARSEVSDAMAGRISLAILDLFVLAMIGFYIWTHNAQGGS